MNENEKWNLPSVSRGTTMLISFGLFQLAMIVGLIFSIDNLNHPAWIVMGFFAVNMLLRGITYDFLEYSDPELKRNMVFGVLKMLTGSLLIAGAILSEGDVVLLGLGLASVFLVLGGKNVLNGAVLLNEKLVERAALRRVHERELEETAQRIRDSIGRLTQGLKQQQVEDELLADLSDSLLGSDSSDGPNK